MADPYAGVEYFPQTLPVNTVVGRIGNVPGPAEAIPFASLTTLLKLGNLAGTVNHAQSPYTSTGSPNVLFVDAVAGAVTINLPSTANKTYSMYVAKTDNSANFVTLTASAGQTINGVASVVLRFPGQGFTIISNSINAWEVFSEAKPITTNFGAAGFKFMRNIFDLMTPDMVALIQAGTNPGYIDAYFNAAIALGGSWYIPRGYYHLAGTLSMLPGVHFHGAGDFYSDDPLQVGTAIYLGGSVGAWGMEMLNSNGTGQVEAFSLYDICFLVTQNGVRWNSITGGFTDDNTSQQYMMFPRIERCMFGMDDPTARIGVQFNKCFDFKVVSCRFSNFYNSLDFEGSDIGTVWNCRFDSDTNYSILANSHATFGSSLSIRDNDFNDPYGFVKSTYLDILIDNNHMEFDRDKTRVTAAIAISGNAFHTKIHNNRVQPGALVTNWLSITNDVNRFMVSVFNNSTSAPTQMGNVSYTAQTYFSNGSTRCLVQHGNNSAGDNAFPMNSRPEGVGDCNVGCAAVVNASTPGVSSSSVLNPLCEFGVFTIHPNADTTQKMVISDWGAYGLDANELIGTLTIEVISAAGAAGQVGSWEVLDNGSSIASGTITHTNAHQYYKTNIATSQAFSSNAVVKFWNADTGHGERFYVKSVAFKIG